MNFKEFCAACCDCGKGDDGSEKSTGARKRKSWKNYCMSCFLPECVRNTVIQVKNNVVKVPLSVEMYVVLLSCEIPAIPEVIDLYSISSSFSIVDVVDELNIHLSGIIKRIVSQGGDVIYLHDDLLQCVWRAESDVNAKCAAALKTAITIQKISGITHTKIGCDLKNRIAITVGELNILYVGTARVYYTVVGSIQKDLKNALRTCGGKNVIVTKEFWNNIIAKEKYQSEEVKEHFIMVSSTTERIIEMDEDAEEEEYSRMENFEFTIENELYTYLQTFHKNAKTSQQLEILTSMSQVVFIAVRTLELDLTSLELLNKATDVVYNTVQEFDGILSRIVSLTSPTFCIYFGLPGNKHKDDAVRGVLCAQRILKAMETLEIKSAIGISAGMLFCGVLGTRLRQECSVLGMAVHIGQNIVNQMWNYQLVCGINTFFRTCRVLGEIFTPIRKRLKGVKSSNLFFKISAEEVKKMAFKTKCVGRKPEKEMLGNALKELKEGIQNLDKDLLPLINITGMLGTGKSNMLSWCMQEGRKLGYRLVARVDNNMFEAPNENAWAIVKQVLASELVDNEAKIMEILGPDANQYPLQQLNRRMNLSFAQPQSISKDDSLRRMMVELIRKSAEGDPILIGLDNAEHTGTESWLFVQSLLSKRCACVVVTFTEEFTTNVPFVRQLIHQQYLGVRLNPMLGKELAVLACHMLNVEAIHKGFLDFLEDKSGGNAIHLREILMLPPLQKHFCLVPYISVTESTLQENFVPAEEGTDVNVYTAKLCDILDPDGLRSIKIPKQLLDVFKDRSTALSPEEQMLMRKCSLLGDTFGLRILEAVCPEFTSNELYSKVQELMDKKILEYICDHCRVVVESADWRKMSLKDVPLEYCEHPLRFVSEFLKQNVMQSMAESQRRRMDLYLADLLRDSNELLCDACRREMEVKRSASQNDMLKNYKIPIIDFRLCRCLNLKTDLLLQEAYHLEKGDADVAKILEVLLEACDTGLEAREVDKVEEILISTRRLMNLYKTQSQPDHIEIAINRIRSKLKLRYGRVNDALRTLKHAFLSLNIVFPNDFEKKKKAKLMKDPLGEEEWKCQALGTLILQTLGEYKEAYFVADYNLKCLLERNAPICLIIDAKVLKLRALMRTPPRKNREKTSRKLITEIKQMCFKRLSERPELNVKELRTIIRAILFLILVFFETAELDAGEDLGRKSFQLLKTINNPKQLARVCFLRANISFYAGDYKKCMEMLSELQDAQEQSGDTVAQVLYYIMLVKVVRETVHNIGENEIKMCHEYAKHGTIVSSCHPKQFATLFCVSAAIALWCMEKEMEEKFKQWHNQAMKLKLDVNIDTYLTVMGSIYLMMIEIFKIKEKCFVFTEEEIEGLKQEKLKSIEILQHQAKDYVPVLEKETKQLEKFLHNAFKGCNVLRGSEKPDVMNRDKR